MAIVWRERVRGDLDPWSPASLQDSQPPTPAVAPRASPSRHGLNRLGRAPVPARCLNGTQAVCALPRRSCSQKLAGPILSLRDSSASTRPPKRPPET